MRQIDADIWNKVMRKQGHPSVLLREAEELTLFRRALIKAVIKRVLPYLIQKAIRKEVKRYLWFQDHNQRIQEFKRKRRWPAV